MQLSPDSLEKFKKLYVKHFGAELDNVDARQQALLLLQLVATLLKREQPPEKNNHNDEKDNENG
jgi:hypothetical protein